MNKEINVQFNTIVIVILSFFTENTFPFPVVTTLHPNRHPF